MTREMPITLVKLIDRARLEEVDIYGNLEARITGLTTSAQKVERSNLFVAIRGTRIDSHLLISDAVERGAAAVMVDRDVPAYPGITMVRVANTRKALGPLAHAFHGHPAETMRLAAVTGTNGKTSTTALIAHLLAHAGRRSAWIGTLGAKWNDRHEDFGTTTPDAVSLAAVLAAMRRDGIDHVSIEASSHGIDQERIGGIPVNVGVLTNVSQDHLDYHGDFPTYVGVKRRLFFDWVAPTPNAVACFNFDDAVGEELCDSYPNAFFSFSPAGKEGCDFHARHIRYSPTGTEFELVAGRRVVPVRTRLLGSFNVANVMAAAAACFAMGIDLPDLASGIAAYRAQPGRFEPIDGGQPFQVIVDYAHTPDALEKVLRTARQLTAGHLITVFGCGGDRDRAKRPLMGEVAGRLSDYAVVTSDNPRNEDPARINADAIVGLARSGMKSSQYQSILDRLHAIERALHLAKPGDCVLIAGKGHETYQEICGVRYGFDDRIAAREVLAGMSANWGRQSTEKQIETADTA